METKNNNILVGEVSPRPNDVIMRTLGEDTVKAYLCRNNTL